MVLLANTTNPLKLHIYIGYLNQVMFRDLLKIQNTSDQARYYAIWFEIGNRRATLYLVVYLKSSSKCFENLLSVPDSAIDEKFKSSKYRRVYHMGDIYS